MIQYEKTKDGQPFIGLSTIYHFYGARKRDYFSLWVQKGYVVKSPSRLPHSNYYMQPIEEVIKLLKKKRYKHEII